jgi:RHS repeat-associated protein
VWRIATSGGVTRTSGLGPDEARLSVGDGSAFAWLLGDLHGNTAAGVNAAETSLSHAWRYDPYGQILAETSGALANPWRFQGRLDVGADSDAALYEFGARHYDPGLGAFTQLDSYAGDAGDPLSLNRYLYAAANPWTLIDPTGHRYEMGAGGSGCRGCEAVAPPPPPRVVPPPPPPPGPMPEGPRVAQSRVTPEYVLATAQAAPAPSALPRQLTECLDPSGCQVPDGVLYALGAVFVVSGGVVVGVAIGPTVAQGAAYASGGGSWGLCVWACDKVNRVTAPILEGVAGAPTNSISTAYATSRAPQLQSLLPLASRGRVTIGVAVAENASGIRVVLVGTSEPRGYLRPVVREAIEAFETVVPSPTRHAEQNIIAYAQSNNLTILSIDAGRPFCPDCARLIDQTLH